MTIQYHKQRVQYGIEWPIIMRTNHILVDGFTLCTPRDLNFRYLGGHSVGDEFCPTCAGIYARWKLEGAPQLTFDSRPR